MGSLNGTYVGDIRVTEAALESVSAADAILYLIPLGSPVVDLADIEPRFAQIALPLAYVFTKSDSRSGAVPDGLAPSFIVSARNGTGLDDVIAWHKLGHEELGRLGADLVLVVPERTFRDLGLARDAGRSRDVDFLRPPGVVPDRPAAGADAGAVGGHHHPRGP